MSEARIVSDPAVMLGKPILEGTRISVEYILEELAYGQPIDVLVDSRSTLSKTVVYAALEYAVKGSEIRDRRTGSGELVVTFVRR